MKTITLVALVVICGFAPVLAQVATQSATEPTFDVVSIKRVNELRQTGGMRTFPDGTFMMMNQPIGTLLNQASPVPVTPRDITGGPDWLWRELYDVTVKPPEGLTRAQLTEMMPLMWRAMFADRMKLVAHIEQREKDAYALVLARSDGRLGPELKPSTIDCTPDPNATPPPPPSAVTAGPAEPLWVVNEPWLARFGRRDARSVREKNKWYCRRRGRQPHGPYRPVFSEGQLLASTECGRFTRP